jgi:hypothetical protein
MENSSLTREELATRWLVKPPTLDNWRRNGKGPKFSKSDSGISYKLEDIEAYEKSRTFQNTADYPPELKHKKKTS